VLVDDTPPLLAPNTQDSITQADSGDSLEREFLASLTTSLISGAGGSESEAVTPNLSVEHMARRRHKSPGDDDSDDEEADRGFEQSGFGIGFAVDKNKRYRRTMEVPLTRLHKSLFSSLKIA
jgi:hypothetical protein